MECDSFDKEQCFAMLQLALFIVITLRILSVASGFTIKDAIHVSCDESGWDIQVDMATLRQADPGARASDIFLGENTCTGIERQGVLYFRQGLRECRSTEAVYMLLFSKCIYTSSYIILNQ